MAVSTGLLAGYCGLAAATAQLAWHGVADLGPLGVLVGAAAGGIALAWAREPLLRWSRAPRSWARDWTGPAAPGRAAGGGMTQARAARR
jgi:hypothetical protein